MALRSARWAISSLWHHILFIVVFASLPVSILFIFWADQDHDLTVTRVVKIVTAWIIAGVIGALAGWYVILPSIRHRGTRKDD